MIDIHIPPAAIEAGAISLRGGRGEADEAEKTAYLDAARAAFLAMIEAWPGMAHYRGGWEPVIHNNRKPHLILPLTEKQDDKA